MLTFFGDVFLSGPVRLEPVLDAAYVFNLESPLTDAGVPQPGKILLRSSARHFAKTFTPPPAAVCLANNHILDYGEAGFEDTLRTLAALGIPSFGAGSLSSNCANPLILDLPGGKVALVGYVCPTTHPIFACADRPGSRPINLPSIREDISLARARGVDRVVVHIHWGVEDFHLPRPEDVRTGRAIVESGADLVIGHHAHRIQSFEFYRGKPIFYGLGNFIMPDLDVPRGSGPDGVPAPPFQKRQRCFNRISLGVRYSIRDGSLAFLRTEMTGNLLNWTPLEAPRVPLLDAPNIEAYALRYRSVLKRHRVQERIMDYWRNPRLPRARQWRTFRSLIANS